MNRRRHLNITEARLVTKIIDLPGGQINDPSLGKHYSLPFLPATPLSQSQTLERLFELSRRPSRALNLTSQVASGTMEIIDHCCSEIR